MTTKRPASYYVAILVALLISCAAFVITKSTSDSDPNRTPIDRLPHVVLWAWERPTDLRFVKTDNVAVAFLARTVRLRGEEIIVRPRMQPLELPDDIKLVAVARIETKSAKLSDEAADQVANAIADLARLPRISAIQIDFDATRSERSFYRDIILRVRRRLPTQLPLSITALTSWCEGDDWLKDLPIEEAVPMLFRMGPDARQISNRLDVGEDFDAAICRQSYGVSTDEARPKLNSSRRLYVFNPDSWTEESVRELLESTK